MRLTVFLGLLLIVNLGFAVDKPPNESVTTLSNSPTSARFFVGVSKDQGGSFTRRFYQSDPLQILAHIEVDAAHLYKFGNVFVVVYVPQFGLLQATRRGFEPWDGRMGNLKAYKTGFLVPVEEISVTDDIVPEGRERIAYTGAVYIAYQLLNQSSDMIFTASPYIFKVLDVASPKEFYEDKLSEAFIGNCIECHSVTGGAAETRLIFSETQQPVDTIEAFLFGIEPGKTLLLNEVAGVFHLGGTIFPIGTTSYNQFEHLLNTLIADKESIIDLHPQQTEPDNPIEEPIDEPIDEPVDEPVDKSFPFTETEVFYMDYLSNVIDLVCRDCHREGSLAWDTELLYLPEDDLAGSARNYKLLFNYISADPASKVYFKPLNSIDHGGGRILSPDGNSISYLGAFIEKIRGIHPLDVEEPTFPFTIAEQFYVDNISGIIQSTCMNCHKTYGQAHNSSLHYVTETDPDSRQANYNLLYDYILADNEFKLFYKPVGGLEHGGGSILETGSAEQNLLGGFINMLRGDLPADTTDLTFPATEEETFYVENVAAIIQSTCINCHVARGDASRSELIYIPGTSAEVQQTNYNLLVSYIVPDDNDNVFNKPVGASNHGGGTVLATESRERNNLGRFIELIRGRYPSDTSTTSFPATAEEIFYSENIAPIIQTVCVICHKTARQASASALIYQQGSDIASQSFNFNLLSNYIAQDTQFNVYHKPAGVVDHGGSTVIAPNSEERAKLGSFIELITGSYPATIEPVFPSTTNELFFSNNISSIIQNTCITCHISRGAAEASALVYVPNSVEGYQQTNYDLLSDYISRDVTFNVFNKPVGATDHGGGSIIAPESEERSMLGTFTQMLTGFYPEDNYVPPLTAEQYFAANLADTIRDVCSACHVSRGAAGRTAMVFVLPADNMAYTAAELSANFAVIENMVLNVTDDAVLLQTKPTLSLPDPRNPSAPSHGGGPLLVEGDPIHSHFVQLIDMISSGL